MARDRDRERKLRLLLGLSLWNSYEIYVGLEQIYVGLYPIGLPVKCAATHNEEEYPPYLQEALKQKVEHSAR